jgi:hypothetical protein
VAESFPQAGARRELLLPGIDGQRIPADASHTRSTSTRSRRSPLRARMRALDQKHRHRWTKIDSLRLPRPERDAASSSALTAPAPVQRARA